MNFGDLGMGSTGAAVSELQAKLRKLGFPVSVTGAFDEATVNALRQFQAKVGLQPDGMLGSATESILNQVVLKQSGPGGALAPKANANGADVSLPPAGNCPRPMWQTALMVAGGAALLYGAWRLYEADDSDDEGYARALNPGREEKDVTSRSRRIAGADDKAKCGRSPDEDHFLKSPRVEA